MVSGWTFAPKPGVPWSDGRTPGRLGNLLGNNADVTIILNMRKSGIPDAGIYGTKVFLANFTIEVPSLDPRLLTKCPIYPDGYYPSVCFFTRDPLQCYCVIHMQTKQTAVALVINLLAQGVIKREILITENGTSFQPIVRASPTSLVPTQPKTTLKSSKQVNHETKARSANSLSKIDSKHVAELQRLLNLVESMPLDMKSEAKKRVSGLKIDICKYLARQYYVTLGRAMETTAIEARQYLYLQCEIIQSLGTLQRKILKHGALLMWMIVFAWEADYKAIHNARFGSRVSKDGDERKKSGAVNKQLEIENKKLVIRADEMDLVKEHQTEKKNTQPATDSMHRVNDSSSKVNSAFQNANGSSYGVDGTNAKANSSLAGVNVVRSRTNETSSVNNSKASSNESDRALESTGVDLATKFRNARIGHGASQASLTISQCGVEFGHDSDNIGIGTRRGKAVQDPQKAMMDEREQNEMKKLQTMEYREWDDEKVYGKKTARLHDVSDRKPTEDKVGGTSALKGLMSSRYAVNEFPAAKSDGQISEFPKALFHESAGRKPTKELGSGMSAHRGLISSRSVKDDSLPLVYESFAVMDEAPAAVGGFTTAVISSRFTREATQNSESSMSIAMDAPIDHQWKQDGGNLRLSAPPVFNADTVPTQTQLRPRKVASVAR